MLHPMDEMEMDPMSGDAAGAGDTGSTTGDGPGGGRRPVGNPVDDLMKDYDGSEDSVMWESKDMTMGDWTQAKVLYTFDKKHTVSGGSVSCLML